MPNNKKVESHRSPKWRSKLMRSPNTNVPSGPGLYAIGHTETHGYGLESKRVYVYIGEAGNLRKRIEQHRVAEEKNPLLQKYLLKAEGKAQCWYVVASGMSKKERLQCEADLIRIVKPKCNRKGKP